jgi:hypothetical protein
MSGAPWLLMFVVGGLGAAGGVWRIQLVEVGVCQSAKGTLMLPA